jgi:hypothetical protein
MITVDVRGHLNANLGALIAELGLATHGERPDGLWTATCPECGSTCPILPGGNPDAPCGLHAPLTATRRPRSARKWEDTPMD